ncbi:MerR family transcriptional regulator [Paenibacillus monticola]|uniref:MerR family transcriptional regulator n=1 Tax=Paenibacillus monticola TaxID=2666075 RepID=A0A7X2H3Q2_9BACL|nr:MerR family transcriptional regulator [Paenibacillus monticola]MRN52940.1 MerR family transcriptional regulator [Paenibacillus monticola]
MKEYITISELSKLMSVSVHQIRYFEEKEILVPAYTDTNKYRMYGVTEIYQLSHILLLRKLNVPVNQIKECISTYSADDYNQLLKESLKKVQSEIDQLMLFKPFIQKILSEHQELNNLNNSYQIKSMNTRHLKQWLQLGVTEVLTARSLYDNKPNLPHLFEDDLHYLYDSNQLTLCFETTDPADVILEKGDYLYIHLLVSEDQDIESEISLLEQYLIQQQYAQHGPIIILEKSYLSIFNNNKLHYEIQVKVS